MGTTTDGLLRLPHEIQSSRHWHNILRAFSEYWGGELIKPAELA